MIQPSLHFYVVIRLNLKFQILSSLPKFISYMYFNILHVETHATIKLPILLFNISNKLFINFEVRLTETNAYCLLQFWLSLAISTLVKINEVGLVLIYNYGIPSLSFEFKG